MKFSIVAEHNQNVQLVTNVYLRQFRMRYAIEADCTTVIPFYRHTIMTSSIQFYFITHSHTRTRHSRRDNKRQKIPLQVAVFAL